jgi:hypothetical protein
VQNSWANLRPSRVEEWAYTESEMISMTVGSGLTGKVRSIWRNSSTTREGEREGEERREKKREKIEFSRRSLGVPEGKREAQRMERTVDASNALQARLGPAEEVGRRRDFIERGVRLGQLLSGGLQRLNGGGGLDGNGSGRLGSSGLGGGSGSLAGRSNSSPHAGVGVGLLYRRDDKQGRKSKQTRFVYMLGRRIRKEEKDEQQKIRSRQHRSRLP